MLPPLLAQNCADSAPPACGAHAHMTSSHVPHGVKRGKQTKSNAEHATHLCGSRQVFQQLRQSPTYSKAASLLWLQGAKDAQQHTAPLKPKKLWPCARSNFRIPSVQILLSQARCRLRLELRLLLARNAVLLLLVLTL